MSSALWAKNYQHWRDESSVRSPNLASFGGPGRHSGVPLVMTAADASREQLWGAEAALGKALSSCTVASQHSNSWPQWKVGLTALLRGIPKRMELWPKDTLNKTLRKRCMICCLHERGLSLDSQMTEQPEQLAPITFREGLGSYLTQALSLMWLTHRLTGSFAISTEPVCTTGCRNSRGPAESKEAGKGLPHQCPQLGTSRLL